MLRAIIVNVGTVAGVSAALLYQPQVEILEFAGGVIGGSDSVVDQNQDAGGTDSNAPSDNQSDNSGKKKKPDGTPSTNAASPSKNKDKNKNKGKGKTNPNSPSPSSSSHSATPTPSHSSSSPEPTNSASPTPTPTPTKSESPTPKPTKTKTPTPTPTPTPSPTGKDGSYAGSRVDVYYQDGGTKRKSGVLKINVVIKNGKVSEIAFVEYPTGEHLKYTNHAYTQTAKPLIGLTVAELKAKKINTKTGATGTSTAFVTSLDAVLQQL